jgi:hypothetical protein
MLPSAYCTTAFYLVIHAPHPAAERSGHPLALPGSYLESLEGMEFLIEREEHAPSSSLVIVGESLLARLTEQCGTMDAALAQVVALADRLGRPVALRVDNSTTFFGPSGWGEERLQGWAGGQAAAVEEAYRGGKMALWTGALDPGAVAAAPCPAGIRGADRRALCQLARRGWVKVPTPVR